LKKGDLGGFKETSKREEFMANAMIAFPGDYTRPAIDPVSTILPPGMHVMLYEIAI